MFKYLEDTFSDEDKFKTTDWEIPRYSKYHELQYTISKSKNGKNVATIRPFFFKRKGKFGFIVGHKLIVENKNNFNREVLIESLSLDNTGKPNSYIFRDKEVLLLEFIKKILQPALLNTAMEVNAAFEEAESDLLKRKMYLVGSGKSSVSQFMGIKNEGPYKPFLGKVNFIFAFTENTRGLAREVFSSLKGTLYPAQFPGLPAMFGVDFSSENVNHICIKDFDKGSIDEIVKMFANGGRDEPDTKTMVIAILPRGYKDQDEAFDAYGYLKLKCLKEGAFCQFVTEDTFSLKDSLKWSASNIGLQIFSKLGGIPWLVKPAKEDCLILGIGSVHERSDESIVKFSAYTVCLDSTGEFNYIKPLTSATDEKNYLIALQKGLSDILETESGKHYRSVVIHIPHKLKIAEINAIREAVKRSSRHEDFEFVFVRINTDHQFLGFSEHNTRVPLEGAIIRLSSSEYLMWAEGIHDEKKVLHKRTAYPLYIDFIHTSPAFTGHLSVLQDILNLTGANWRGFNAKSQPISIYYSKLIANFMKEFSHIEIDTKLSVVSAESSAPWFL